MAAEAGKARIAYFVSVHHKPRRFERLMEELYTEDDLFLLHVDAKSRLGLRRDRSGVMDTVRRFAAGRANVHIMRSRFTNWGGWSLSAVLLAAIREALRRDAGWTHFVNLSGQCLPLRTPQEIRSHLAASGDQQFIELRPFASLPADDWHLRFHPMLETPLRAFKLPGRRPEPQGFAFGWKGSQWVILTRAFCEWAEQAPIRKPIFRYLRRMLLSDELLMQTLVVNSPWRDKIAAHYGRAIFWPGPKVLTEADLPDLRAGSALFARKFDDLT